MLLTIGVMPLRELLPMMTRRMLIRSLFMPPLMLIMQIMQIFMQMMTIHLCLTHTHTW